MSTITIYTAGTEVRFSATFAADPTTVTLSVKEPSGTTTIYTYGTDPELVRDGVGEYHADLVLNTAGLWWYKFAGSGAVTAVKQDCIFVSEAQV
jgi:hypothetical protein